MQHDHEGNSVQDSLIETMGPYMFFLFDWFFLVVKNEECQESVWHITKKTLLSALLAPFCPRSHLALNTVWKRRMHSNTYRHAVYLYTQIWKGYTHTKKLHISTQMPNDELIHTCKALMSTYTHWMTDRWTHTHAQTNININKDAYKWINTHASRH